MTSLPEYLPIMSLSKTFMHLYLAAKEQINTERTQADEALESIERKLHHCILDIKKLTNELETNLQNPCYHNSDLIHCDQGIAAHKDLIEHLIQEKSITQDQLDKSSKDLELINEQKAAIQCEINVNYQKIQLLEKDKMLFFKKEHDIEYNLEQSLMSMKEYRLELDKLRHQLIKEMQQEYANKPVISFEPQIQQKITALTTAKNQILANVIQLILDTYQSITMSTQTELFSDLDQIKKDLEQQSSKKEATIDSLLSQKKEELQKFSNPSYFSSFFSKTNAWDKMKENILKKWPEYSKQQLTCLTEQFNIAEKNTNIPSEKKNLKVSFEAKRNLFQLKEPTTEMINELGINQLQQEYSLLEKQRTQSIEIQQYQLFLQVVSKLEQSPKTLELLSFKELGQKKSFYTTLQTELIAIQSELGLSLEDKINREKNRQDKYRANLQIIYDEKQKHEELLNAATLFPIIKIQEELVCITNASKLSSEIQRLQDKINQQTAQLNTYQTTLQYLNNQYSQLKEITRPVEEEQAKIRQALIEQEKKSEEYSQFKERHQTSYSPEYWDEREKMLIEEQINLIEHRLEISNTLEQLINQQTELKGKLEQRTQFDKKQAKIDTLLKQVAELKTHNIEFALVIQNHLKNALEHDCINKNFTAMIGNRTVQIYSRIQQILTDLTEERYSYDLVKINEDIQVIQKCLEKTDANQSTTMINLGHTLSKLGSNILIIGLIILVVGVGREFISLPATTILFGVGAIFKYIGEWLEHRKPPLSNFFKHQSHLSSSLLYEDLQHLVKQYQVMTEEQHRLESQLIQLQQTNSINVN